MMDLNLVNTDLEELSGLVKNGEALPGWDYIKPGTYCAGRERTRTQTFTFSAAYYNAAPTYLLNVITEPSTTDPRATLGLLNDSSRPIYRINFRSTHGWHIDSEKYNISHAQLENVNGWRDALSLITNNTVMLPLVLDLVDMTKFTDPESIFRH